MLEIQPRLTMYWPTPDPRTLKGATNFVRAGAVQLQILKSDGGGAKKNSGFFGRVSLLNREDSGLQSQGRGIERNVQTCERDRDVCLAWGGAV